MVRTLYSSFFRATHDEKIPLQKLTREERDEGLYSPVNSSRWYPRDVGSERTEGSGILLRVTGHALPSRSVSMEPPLSIAVSFFTRRCTTWVAILLFGCLATSPSVGKDRGAVVAPVYRIDLRSVVSEPYMIESWSGAEGRSGTPIRSLDFLDDARLAVTVVKQATGMPGLATRDEPNTNSAFRLNVVLIGASSGRILDTPDWPSNSRYAGIIAVSDNGFVTERGEELTLYSLDLSPVKRLSLPPLPAGKFTEYWSPHPSWSGKRVLLYAGPVWTKIHWLWVDAENLRLLESWEDVLTSPVTVSDHAFAMKTGGQTFGGTQTTIAIGEPGGNWKSVPSTEGAIYPQFVGPDLLYFSRFLGANASLQNGIFLMRTDSGEVHQLGPPKKGWGLARAITCRTGRRFVIPLVEVKGSYRAFDIGGYDVLRGFLVFDPPFRAPSFTLLVKDSRIKNPEMPALSPDGRHLAIFAYPDPIVEVYELPPGK